MKITIEIPNTTVGAFFNCVFSTDTGRMAMGVRQIDTDDLKSGEVIVCRTDHPTEKGGVNNDEK